MATQIVKDALLLCAGMLIGFGMWAALPPEPPKIERIHVPHYQTRQELVEIKVEVAKACMAPRACPPHRSLEALAKACAEGRLTHDGHVGILVED